MGLWCPKGQQELCSVSLPCSRRDLAFRLKPLEMSDQLINQLKALQNQMEKQARRLQDLLNEDKQKLKHYTPVMQEAPNVGDVKGWHGGDDKNQDIKNQ